MLITISDKVFADTEGFFLGLGLYSSQMSAEDRKEGSPPGSVYIEESGGGMSLLIGYGFTPSFTTRITTGAAEHKTSDPDVTFLYGGASIEAVYYFREGNPFRPYVFGGLGGYVMKSMKGNLTYSTAGPGTTLGGGFTCFLNEHFALDCDLRMEFINWETKVAEIDIGGGTVTTVETPIEEEGEAGKMMVGVSYWF